MITVITEHLTLLTAKTGMHAAGAVASAGTIGPRGTDIVEAINRALGDTTDALNAAITALPFGDIRLAARQAFDALNTATPDLAGLDIALDAAAILPADVDTDDDIARLRARREAITADINRHIAALAHALADARADITAEAPAAERRCPECGTIAPGHSTVHERYPEGGGGTNRPCSRSNGASA
jgi:hypothetical protein